MTKLIIILFALLLLSSPAFSQENLEYEFIELENVGMDFIKAIGSYFNDYNVPLDQSMFGYVSKDDNRYYLRSLNRIGKDLPQKYLWEISDSLSNISMILFDKDNDGKQEFIYSYIFQDSVFMEIRNENQKFQSRYGLFQINRESIGFRTDFVCIMDVDNDGSFEAIIKCSDATGRSRRICCYNIDSGQFVWKFLLASPADKVEVCENKIVIGTTAPQNGRMINGMSDNNSYLIVINRDGSLLWKREIGFKYSMVSFHVYDNIKESKKEIYYIERNGGAGYPRTKRLLGKRYLFTGKLIEQNEIDGNPFSFSVFRKKDPDIIVTVENGKILYVFNEELKLKKPVEIDLKNPHVQIVDINDDGTEEVVLHNDVSMKLHVLNHNYKKVAEKSNVFRYKTINNPSGKNKIFLNISDSYLSINKIKKINIFLYYLSYMNTFQGGVFLTLLTVLVIWGVKNKTAKNKNPDNKNYVMSPEAKKERQNLLNWLSLAQKISHDIKNPLSTILLSIQRLEKKVEPDVSSKYLSAMKDEISRLTNMSNLFLKVSNVNPLKKEAVELKELLDSNIDFFKKSLSYKISIKVNVEDNIPLLRVDVQHFSLALRNIIENAVDAVGEKGKIEIKIFLSENISNGKINKMINLEISDDGAGISNGNIENLYRPGYTTKPSGTGYGIVIAKEIVETYGGSIKIYSRENIGTIVTIKIPAA